jgi:hypothetical protein
MAADYILEQGEEDYREAIREQRTREAAIIIIINGLDHREAVNRVEEIEFLRKEAERKGEVILDYNEDIESYLDQDLEPPSSEGLNEERICAIQQELLKNY